LHLERFPVADFRLPPWRTVFRWLAGFFIPGLVFYWEGRPLIAKWILRGCAVAAVVFVVFLGRLPADIAFFLLIGAQVVSATHQVRPVVWGSRVPLQMVFSVVLFVALTQWLYLPARDLFYRGVALPLQVEERVVIVNPRASRIGVKRGDLVAYRIIGYAEHGVVVRDGFGLQPVLGLPGDVIEYGPAGLKVNGRTSPSLPHMSQPGGLAVPENHWFIWPQLHTGGYGNNEAYQADAYRNLALVNQENFVGRSYRWWFFWKQTLP
jgi:signal peptidase I